MAQVFRRRPTVAPAAVSIPITAVIGSAASLGRHGPPPAPLRHPAGLSAPAAPRRPCARVYDIGAIRPGAVEGEPVMMGEKPRASGGSIEINAADLPRTMLGTGVGVGVGAL
ncbi:hypothetical protein B0H11DRAFT_2245354 [Mycena galericulata]|nr:hypothetical protein B0H11DRAFT_2245354 [Mycena galericulata]